MVSFSLLLIHFSNPADTAVHSRLHKNEFQDNLRVLSVNGVKKSHLLLVSLTPEPAAATAEHIDRVLIASHAVSQRNQNRPIIERPACSFLQCRLEFYLLYVFFLCWFRRTNSAFLCWHRQMFVIRSVDRLPLVLNSFLVRLGTFFPPFYAIISIRDRHEILFTWFCVDHANICSSCAGNDNRMQPRALPHRAPVTWEFLHCDLLRLCNSSSWTATSLI